MYDEKLFLTPQEILNKEFKIDAKGYRPQEVDKFLDMVIRDYTEFTNVIKKVQNDGDSLIRNYLLCNPDISRYIILDDGSGSYYSSEIKEHIIRICNNKAKMIDNDDMDNMLNGLNAVRHVR